MRVLVVYNERRGRGGEDVVVEATERILRDGGHDVQTWRKHSVEVDDSTYSKTRAFFSGIHSRSAQREAHSLASQYSPDVVHAHNLYPGFSPAIIGAFRNEGIPVVLHAHNFFLTCPIGTHFRDGSICTDCMSGGPSRALLHNCRGDLKESLAYACRSAAAKYSRVFLDDVDAIIAPSEFVKQHLLMAGYPSARISVVENSVPFPSAAAQPDLGNHVAYVGRLSAEKGVDLLLQACADLPIPLQLGGDGVDLSGYRSRSGSSVEFLGYVDGDAKDRLYRHARFAVAPSVSYETFCLSVAEAMAYGLPVIASRLGGPQYLIKDGETGLLFEPGNASDLRTKILALWNDPALCSRLGANARIAAALRFKEATYMEHLIALYRSVARIHKGNPR